MVGFTGKLSVGPRKFQVGLASVVCIFADAPEALVTEKADLRRTCANEFGVPCIGLEAAISIGFLQELGVCRPAVEQIRAWIEADRRLAQGPEALASTAMSPRRNEREASELTERERQIARSVAQGMTNVEIARSISLNSRVVDFHMYRLIEKLRSRRGGE